MSGQGRAANDCIILQQVGIYTLLRHSITITCASQNSSGSDVVVDVGRRPAAPELKSDETRQKRCDANVR